MMEGKKLFIDLMKKFDEKHNSICLSIQGYLRELQDVNVSFFSRHDYYCRLYGIVLGLEATDFINGEEKRVLLSYLSDLLKR